MDNRPIEFCEHEHDVVVAAVARTLLSDDLAEHVRFCVVCGAALEVASQLGLLAASGGDDPLPSAGFIQWRANLRERQAASRLSEQVLRWSGWCAAVVLLLTIGAIAPATLENLPGSGSVLWVGLGGLTCILASSLATLALWRRIDR
jgi:hypothetical protein